MKMTTKRVIRFGLLIAWLGLTILLSEQTGAESARLSSRITKWLISNLSLNIEFERLNGFMRELAHFGIHFVLAILSYRAFLTVFREKASVFVSLLLCGAIAAFDEFTQVGIPGRAREIYDLLLNFLGVSIGVNLSYLISKPLIKKPR